MHWLRSLPIHLLIVLMLMIMALPSVALIINAGVKARSEDLRHSTRATTYLLNNIASELNSKVEGARQMMDMLSLMPAVRQKDSAAVHQLLADLKRKFPVYANIIVVDRDGVSWADALRGSKTVSLADRKAFKDARESGLFSTGEYVTGKTSNKQIINFAFPLKGKDGSFDGAILFGLDLERIGSFLKTDKLPPGTSFGIFDHKGTFIYRTVDPERFIGQPDRTNAFEKMKNGPDEGAIDLVSNDGVHRLAVYRKVRLAKDLPPYAYIRGGTPTDILLQAATSSLVLNLTAMTLLLALVFALVIWLSKRLIVNRIAALENASRRLASGDLTVRVTREAEGGELGRLGRSFDEMADALSFELSERMRNEDVLREKSELLELAHDAIILRELDGNILYWNQGAAAMYRYPTADACGRNIHDLLKTAFPVAPDRIDAELLREGRWEGKLVHTTSDGSPIAVSSRWALQYDKHGRPWRVMEINSDITEREKSQQELLTMQKLESLGVLAGGIAHDFNNILTGILGNISLVQMALDQPERAQKMLLQAEKACQRASQLSTQLLTFAKGGTPVKKAVAARLIVEEAVSLALRGSNVLSILEIPDDLRNVEVDEGQIYQAFNNIIINGMQSMPDGGTFTVTASDVTLEQGNPLSVAAGEYVRFSFRDTGCGISPEDRKKIFDPYFTTKSGGKGLGLASAHSVVVRHGGHISVQSEVGKGTTFEVLLPASGRDAAESEALPPAAQPTQHARYAVLVMDDEEVIRELACAMLSSLGCRVTTCVNGTEAVSLYAAAKHAGAPFDVVIMDLTIPGAMGGKEAAARILEIDPGASLVVSSGYSNDPVMSDHVRYGFKATMVKPYRVSEVTEVLKKVMSDGAPWMTRCQGEGAP